MYVQFDRSKYGRWKSGPLFVPVSSDVRKTYWWCEYLFRPQRPYPSVPNTWCDVTCPTNGYRYVDAKTHGCKPCAEGQWDAYMARIGGASASSSSSSSSSPSSNSGGCSPYDGKCNVGRR